jgi:hypothetical protein
MSSLIYMPSNLRESAARLAAVLRAEPSAEYRLGVLKRLARRLGENAYPVFLKLLAVIAESDDEVAKQAIADSLVVALKRMDLPSGQLTSWGGSHMWQKDAPVQAGTFNETRQSNTPRRQLGPIEFLTAWYAQRTQLPQLDESRYAQVLTLLIELCNRNAELRRLYSAKLVADSRNELEGAYTRITCDALAAIAQAWMNEASPADIAHAATGHRALAPGVPRGWVLRDL